MIKIGTHRYKHCFFKIPSFVYEKYPWGFTLDFNFLLFCIWIKTIDEKMLDENGEYHGLRSNER